MSSSSSRVPDEDSQTRFAEGSWLQGAIIAAIAYGIIIPLYFLSLHLLMRKRNRVEFKKRLPLLIYISASFVLSTAYMIILAALTQMTFIDDYNYSSGPSPFKNEVFSIPVHGVASATFILSNWLSDALVVWRFKVIYQPMSRVPLWMLMFFPCLMLAVLVALGILYFAQYVTSNPYSLTNHTDFTLAYFILSLAVNVIFTIAIVLRLLTFRYRIASAMGPKYGSHYTSIAAMIIESAAPYSAISIALIILFVMGNTLSIVFIQSSSQFQTIATLVIVFRVAQGKAWTQETATYVMSSWRAGIAESGDVQFATPQTSTSIRLVGSGEIMDKSSRVTHDVVAGAS